MSRKRNARAIALIDRLYDTLPSLECKGLCAESCGPLGMSRAEYDRLAARVGRPVTFDEHLTCSVLVEGRCSAYSARPLICRLWGLVESMPCPHGCVPTRVLPDAVGKALLDRARVLGGESVLTEPEGGLHG